MSADIVLDPQIKVWVLCPILIVMVLVGFIRHYATIVLQPAPARLSTPKVVTEQEYLHYGRLFVENSFNLPPRAVRPAANYLAEKFRGGAYLADPDAPPPNNNPLNAMDPKNLESMVAGMRKQIVNYVPQTLIMSWVTSFFGGIIVMKLPFPLTYRFKSMLQAGIATDSLDIRWVSSVSWYIFLFMGLESVFSLILKSADSTGQEVQIPMQSAPNIDPRKLFTSEADSLELMRPVYVLTGVERRVLGIAKNR